MGLFTAPKGFELLSKSIESNLMPIKNYFQKESERIAAFVAALDTPRNRMELQIYRKALKGQSPEIARIIKQLLSRLNFVFITLQNLETHFPKNKLRQ